MMRKNIKMLTMILAFVMIFGTTAAFAAEGDIFLKSNQTMIYTANQINISIPARNDVRVNPSLYQIEVANVNYDLAAASAAYVADPVNWKANLAGVDLKVLSVSAIDETSVTVKFAASATKEYPEAVVVVKDNDGNVVATESALVLTGDTEATFEFVTAVATAKLVGVWTVDGIAFNLDEEDQVEAITDAAAVDNEIVFQAALAAAGITYKNELAMEAYMVAIDDIENLDPDVLENLGLEDDFTLETLADVQEVINAVDALIVKGKANAAKLIAIGKANSQAKILAALEANFDAVNSDWIVGYVYVADLDDDVRYTIRQVEMLGELEHPLFFLIATGWVEEIQEDIYDVNQNEIDTVDTPTTATEQAKYTTLLVKWMKPDVAPATDKEEAIQESKVKEAEFKVAEAKNQNTLYNALVNYANVAADEDNPAILKVSDLNTNLRSFYFAQVYHTDVKTSIVDPADVAAKKSALNDIVAAFGAINAAELVEVDSTTPALKTALKTALQDLAKYTSHKTGDDKFDMSIVIDANMVAYAAEFAEATVISNTSDVIDVINDVNAANENVVIDAQVKAINKATTVAQVKSALDKLENADALTDYLEIRTSDLVYIAGYVLENRPDAPGYTDATSIDDAVTAAVSEYSDALDAINAITSTNTINDVVGKLDDILDEGFDGLNNIQKQAVAENFFDSLVFDSSGDLKVKFVSLSAVKAAAGL